MSAGDWHFFPLVKMCRHSLYMVAPPPVCFCKFVFLLVVRVRESCALRAVFLDPPYLLEPHEEIGWGTRFLRPCKAGAPGYVFAKFLRERVLGGLIAQT